MAKGKKKFEMDSMKVRKEKYLKDPSKYDDWREVGGLNTKGHRLMAKGYFKDAKNETNPDKRALLYRLGEQESHLAAIGRMQWLDEKEEYESAAGELEDLKKTIYRQQTGQGFYAHNDYPVMHTRRYEQYAATHYPNGKIARGEDPLASNYGSVDGKFGHRTQKDAVDEWRSTRVVKGADPETGEVAVKSKK